MNNYIVICRYLVYGILVNLCFDQKFCSEEHFYISLITQRKPRKPF